MIEEELTDNLPEEEEEEQTPVQAARALHLANQAQRDQEALESGDVVSLPPVQPSDVSSEESRLETRGIALEAEGMRVQALRRARAAYEEEGRSLESEQLKYGAWRLSSGVMDSVGDLFNSERGAGNFWTEDNWNELVEPLSSERRSRMLEAETEADAREIAEHFRRADQMSTVWNEEVKEAGIGGGAANLLLQMTDPGTWLIGAVAGKAASMGIKAASAAKAVKAGADAVSKYSTLIHTAKGAGIMGSADALTGYMYAKVAQSGSPLVTDQDVIDYTLWGGVFGAGMGGIGGAIRGARASSYHKAVIGTRKNHSAMFMQTYGPKLHRLFENLVATSPKTRAQLAQRLKELRKMALEGTSGKTKEGVKLSALSIEPTRIGPGGNVVSDVADELGVTELIDDLNPQELTNFWNDVSKGLELEQAQRMAEQAVRRAESLHVLGLTNRDLKELAKNAEVGKDTVDSMLAAQAALLKETDKVGIDALSRVVEGDVMLLDNDQIKWLTKNRPEVFGKNGLNLDELLESRKLDGVKLRKSIDENLKRLEEQREMLGKKEFKKGDVVMTEDGRVGRVGDVGEDGKLKMESFEYAQTSKQITETKKKIADVEEKVKAGKARPDLQGRKDKLQELENELKRLEEELQTMDAAEVFEAPAGVSARFTMAEDVGFTSPKKWKVGGRYKKTGQRPGAPKQLSGRFYGENVRLTSTLTVARNLPRLDVKNRIWTMTFGGRNGKDFVVRSEGWWDHQIATGKVKVTDVEYRQRTVLQDGGTQKSLLEQVDNIVRKEALARYEKKVLSRNKARHLELSRMDDPVNLLDELAEGRIPKELKEALGEEFSDDALVDWARTQQRLSPDVVEKLKRGEEVKNVEDMAAKGMDINDPSAPQLDPFTAFMSGRMFGINSVNVWGLTHQVGAIRRLWSLGFGSWYSLIDPITGKAIRAGGEADSLFAGGALNYRKTEVKSRMAPYSEALTEELVNFKKTYKGSIFKLGGAEDAFDKMIKKYVEQGSLEGVPAENIKSVTRVGKEFQRSIADVLEWAKKNGVDELENVKARDTYFPRYRYHAMMEKIVNQHTNRELDDTLKRSLLAANDGMSPEAAEIIAKKLRRYYMQPSGGRPLNDTLLGFQNESLEDFMDALDGSLKSVDQEILKVEQRRTIKNAFGAGAAKSRHGKRRIELDMGVTTNKKVDGRYIPVSELFEWKTTAVLERYMIDLVSKAQEHSLVKMFETDNYKPKNLDELLGHIEDRVGEIGINSGAVGKQLEMFKKFIRNEPKFERDTLSNVASVVRQYATILKLPGFVPSQIPEAITGFFSTGFFPKLRRKMPILKNLADDAIRGRIDKKDAAKFLHFHLGMGKVEHELSMLYAHHELIEEGSTLVSGKLVGKMYGYQSQLIPRLSKWSGFRQINAYSDLVAHRNFTDLLVEAARTNKRDMFNPKRLASYGLTQRDFEDVLQALNQEGVITKEGIKGTDVYTLNYTKMEPSAAAKYRTMAAANIRQVVQRSHAWDQPMGLVGSPWGEFLTQFRTFSISSMNNHFARNLQAADKFAFSQVSSMFVGGLATHFAMSNLHFHDNPTMLAEALTEENWIKGALIRSGFMGMIPDFVDLPYSFATGETIFSPSNKAMLLSIPVFDTIRDLSEAGKTTFRMLTDQDTYGKQDYVYRKTIPFTNLWYWRLLVEAMIPDDTPILSKL